MSLPWTRPRGLWLPLILMSACSSKPEEPAPASVAAPAKSARQSSPSAAKGAIASAGPVGVAGGFEGEIGLVVARRAESKGDTKLRLQVKGTKLRFALPEGVTAGDRLRGGYFVFDATARQALIVMAKQRRAMLLPLDRISPQMVGLPAEPAAQGREAKVERTGKQNTVAGRTCELWKATRADGSRSEVCVSDERADWLALSTLGLPGEHDWARSLLDGAHLPLRIVVFDEHAKEQGRAEVTEIVAKPLDDALFGAPEGFSVMDTTALLQAAAARAGQSGVAPVPGQAQLMPGLKPGNVPPPKVQAELERLRKEALAMQQQGVIPQDVAIAPGSDARGAKPAASTKAAARKPSSALAE